MTARANEHRGCEVVAHPPQASLATDLRNGRSKPQTRARSLKQVLIELASADAVADRVIVRRVHISAMADDADAEPRERLERPSVAVLFNIEFADPSRPAA